MAKLIAMYGIPTDREAFDRYYFAKHVPIAKTIPGLRHYEVTRGSITTPDGIAPYHLIAILTFDSVAAVQSGLGSAQGKATADDLANFASGGVELMIAETAPV
jgi:uncharacterized protein (TIGR02118 family)